MNDSAKEETTASTNGPWVVVTRRRHEARNQRNGGTSMGQVRDQPNQGLVQNGMEKVMNMGKLHTRVSHRLAKDMKRKLAPTRELAPIRELNGPLLENSIQRLVKDGALKVAEVSPTNMGLVINDKGLKSNMKNSVKGKKALARARHIQSGTSNDFSLAEQKILSSSQGRNGHQNPRDSPITLLTSKPWPETGFQFRGEDSHASGSQPCHDPCRDAEKFNPRSGLGMGDNLASMEMQRPKEESDCKGRLPTHAGTSVDRGKERAMDVSDGFSGNEGGAVVEDGNEFRFHKPHGELNVSKIQGVQSSQGTVGEGFGIDALQRGIDVDRMVFEGGGGDGVVNC